MYVIKRDGRQEAVHFDKITARLKKLSYGLSIEHCDPVLVSQKVCAGVYKGVTTSQLDELAAETAAAMTANHPDYACVSSAQFCLYLAILASIKGVHSFVWWIRLGILVACRSSVQLYCVMLCLDRVICLQITSLLDANLQGLIIYNFSYARWRFIIICYIIGGS